METQKPQIGINNTSGDWFKIKIDRAELKELSRRSDYEGWKHIILFFSALIGLGLLCYSFWGTWWFIPIYLAYCTLWGGCLLYTSPSPRDKRQSRMPSSA